MSDGETAGLQWLAPNHRCQVLMVSHPPGPVEVCAAVIVSNGCFLLARRLAGTHLGGAWEFPGGKLRPGEDPGGCIHREILEELGLELLCSRALISIEHSYPEKAVLLHFRACDIAPESVPEAREGQEFGWFAPTALPRMDLAPADRRFSGWLLTTGSRRAIGVRLQGMRAQR